MHASHVIRLVLCLFVLVGWSDARQCQDCNTDGGYTCGKVNYKTTACDGLCYTIIDTGNSHTVRGCSTLVTENGCRADTIGTVSGNACYCSIDLCNVAGGGSGDGSTINSKQRHAYAISIATFAFIILISRWTIL